MNCPHRDDKNCAIAARLAGLDRITIATDAACDFCETRANPPRARNKVTCDLAAAALRAAGRADDALALIKSAPDIYPPQTTNDRLQKILAGTGPGSQLWLLLEAVSVRHTPTCPCLDFAERMNAWGPAGCRLARQEIVDHLRDEQQRYGWARSIQAAARAATQAAAALAAGRRPWLNPLDPYGSLLDEAIRRAEASEMNGEREGVSPPVNFRTDER